MYHIFFLIIIVVEDGKYGFNEIGYEKMHNDHNAHFSKLISQ